jgi:hypothetical protein
MLMIESEEQFEKRALGIKTMISHLLAGCSQDEFLKFRCPVCGDGLSLFVHPNRRILFMRCKQSSTYVGVHQQLDHWVDWWANFESGGWYADTRDRP